MSYSDINHVVLIGRLTRDPELRALPSGSSVCSLRVACNGLRKDGDSYQERPNYFDVSVFGGQGENVERYLRKGARLAVAGRLEWREWETAESHKRQAVCVVADSVQFLDSPSGASRGGRSGGEGTLDGDGALDDSGESRELVGAGVGGSEDDLVF